MQVFFSTSGGAGTSVVVAASAVARARSSSVLVIDLGGDQAAVLGCPEPSGLQLDDWLGSDAEPEAIARLEVDASDHISLLAAAEPGGSGPSPARLGSLMAWVQAQSRPVLVDVGSRRGVLADAFLRAATERVLVTRACYLALRRLPTLPFAPTRVVCILEPGRALGRAEVEAVADAPVAVARWDPAVARAVDAGLLSTRLPRSYVRSLSRAETHASSTEDRA